MEWVETTGRSVAEALDFALDQLGVDETEVEYEILAEPRGGLFGRFGGADARIRARVRPVSREKPGDRRRRRGSGGSGGGGDSRNRSRGGSGGSAGGKRSGSRADAGTSSTGEGSRAEGNAGDEEASAGGAETKNPRKRRRRRRSGGSGGGPTGPTSSVAGGSVDDEDEVAVSESQVSIDEQAKAAAQFLEGLVGAFGVQASVSTRIEDEIVSVDVDGEDLGLLVGPKGATLSAIEELTRTVVQRHAEGHGARLLVDVAGYRAKRRAALATFTQGLAAKALEEGKEVALEPMSAADRKVVHDTVGEIDGVSTYSEGEEPRRRVVIRPAE